jgi:uncharacterized protein (TIGR03086 family)
MSGPDLGHAAAEITRLLDGVDDARLGDTTPCEGLSLGALLAHLVGLTKAFTDCANKAPQDPAARGGASLDAELDPDWRTLLPKQLDELVAAWRNPAAWEGMATAGGVTMPAEVMGVVALDELVLHGWDLARATGQEFSCDDAAAAAVLEFTRMASAPEFAENRVGLFGPVLDVPPDGSAFEQALAYAGRNATWTPS